MGTNSCPKADSMISVCTDAVAYHATVLQTQVSWQKQVMKIFLTLLIFGLLLYSCRKPVHNPVQTTSAACLKTTFLPVGFAESLQAVFFLNGKEGFVAGANGGIYKTTDSANTWTRLNYTAGAPVRGLFFPDAQTGFAVGGQNSCSGSGCIPPGGFILKTADGGKSWNKVYTPADRVEITSVYFTDAGNGVCVGDNVIFKTTDGGLTWRETRLSNLGAKMMQVKFAGQQAGYIACLFGKIVRTGDGGVTWHIINTGANTGYYSIAEASGAIYLSGQGKIIRSTNAGTSWNELPNSPTDIFALHFVDLKRGFAFGRGRYSGGDFGHYYGSIYCTGDGGATWNGTDGVQETGLIESVSFPAPALGYAISGRTVIRLSAN